MSQQWPAAAASLGRFRNAGLAGEAILIPELQGQADDGNTALQALVAQHRRDGRGIDATGHGYGDGLSP